MLQHPTQKLKEVHLHGRVLRDREMEGLIRLVRPLPSGLPDADRDIGLVGEAVRLRYHDVHISGIVVRIVVVVEGNFVLLRYSRVSK